MKHILMIAAAAAISAGVSAPIEVDAAVSVDPAVASAGAPNGLIERAGCYRLGETGYHWYSFCLGPRWLYPHRVCRHHHRYC